MTQETLWVWPLTVECSQATSLVNFQSLIFLSSDEETKFGLDENELKEILSESVLGELKNVRINGLMGMATNTSDQEKVLAEFSRLNTFFQSLSAAQLPANAEMKILSMGMSGDYPLAIKAGSNMIRVGSKIFGERKYA